MPEHIDSPQTPVTDEAKAQIVLEGVAVGISTASGSLRTNIGLTGTAAGVASAAIPDAIVPEE